MHPNAAPSAVSPCDSEANASIPTPALPSLEAFQALLVPSGYAVGPWSIADIVVAPMMVRFIRLAGYEIGKYPMGEGKKLLKALAEPRFARLLQYYELLWQRPSVQATWDEVRMRHMMRR